MPNPWERDWASSSQPSENSAPWERDWNSQETPEASVVDRAKDTAVDLAKGVVSLGESAVGLGDIATFGTLGDGLAKLGYDPQRTQAFLSGLQSEERQAEDKAVSNADGFWDTAKALGVNPAVIVGNIVQSLPGTIGAGAVGGQVVKKLAGAAMVEARAAGLVGDDAAKFVADRVKEQAGKVIASASGAEGAQAAGSIAETGRQSGQDWSTYAAPAVAAGVGTAVIGRAGGAIANKLGIGDIETNVAGRAAGIKDLMAGRGGLVGRATLEGVKEGGLEEMPQSAQEQFFTNLATGKPGGEGVAEAAATGAITGAGMGGAHALLTRPEQQDQAPAIPAAPPGPALSALPMSERAAAAKAAADQAQAEALAPKPLGPDAAVVAQQNAARQAEIDAAMPNRGDGPQVNPRLRQQTAPTGPVRQELINSILPDESAYPGGAWVEPDMPTGDAQAPAPAAQPAGALPNLPPNPMVVFRDGTVARAGEVDAEVARLEADGDAQGAADLRAKVLGYAPQPGNANAPQATAPAAPTSEPRIFQKSGKPFSTEKAAQLAIKSRKLTGHAPVAVDGGFAIEKAKAEQIAPIQHATPDVPSIAPTAYTDENQSGKKATSKAEPASLPASAPVQTAQVANPAPQVANPLAQKIEPSDDPVAAAATQYSDKTAYYNYLRGRIGKQEFVRRRADIDGRWNAAHPSAEPEKSAITPDVKTVEQPAKPSILKSKYEREREAKEAKLAGKKPQSDAQKKAAADRRKRTTTVNPAKDSLFAAIAKLGGLSRTEAEKQGVDPANFKTLGYGIKRVYTPNGETFDGMAELLSEMGYPVRDEAGRYNPNTLLDKLIEAHSGKFIGTYEGIVAKAEREADNREEPPADVMDALADVVEESGVSESVSRLAETIVRAKAAIGDQATQAILDDAEYTFTGTDETADLLEQAIDEARAEQRDSGSEGAGEGSRAQGGVQETKTAAQTEEVDPLLSVYDAAELRRREDAAKAEQKRQDAEEAKAKADDERDSFVLAGSNRTADQAEARGQNSLFDAGGKASEPAAEQRSEPAQVESAPADKPAYSRKSADKKPFDQTQTEAFKQWSNNAPLISAEAAATHQFKTGERVVVEAFHGTARPDRVGTKFLRKRATSGPMAFHTSDPTLASGYAQGKQDTSLAYEDQQYENWFKFKPEGSRSSVDIVRAWYYLDGETKARIREIAPKLRLDDETQEHVVVEEGNARGNGSYDYNLQETQRGYDRTGNPLKALVEDWLSSGVLYNDEELFMDVLRKSGFPIKQVTFDSPMASYPFVYKNFIAMQNPLVTNDVPESVIQALKDAAKRDRSRSAAGGADMWDKNTRTLREWVDNYLDPANTMTSYVWTSIPDKVTDVFRSLGYDGIIDWSGKGGGAIVAPVYIPFNETQVKSAIGNKGKFDGDKKDILHSRKRGWSGFPDAVIAQRSAQDHSDYASAKTGDMVAAMRLARDLVTDEYVEKIRSQIGDGNPIIAPVRSAEKGGAANAIPQAAARVLGAKLGLRVDQGGIRQQEHVGRSGADGFHRLASQPTFTGSVEPENYLIIDDTLAQGGTLAQLKEYIEDNGGRVVLASALTGKQYSAKIALNDDLLNSLQDRYGAIEPWWRAAFGYGFAGLTQSEARYILNSGLSPDALRERIIEAGVPRDGRYRRQADSGRLSGLSPASSVSDLETTLRKPLAALRKTFPVNVVQSADEVPGNHPDDIRGVWMDGEIWLIADNIDPNEAKAVLAHEQNHLGVDIITGGNLSHYTTLIQGEISNGNKTFIEARDYVRTTHGQLNARAEASEIIALMAERNPDHSFVRRIVTRVRLWLAKFGLGNIAAAEINQLIIDAARITTAATRSKISEPVKVNSNAMHGESDGRRNLAIAFSRFEKPNDFITAVNKLLVLRPAYDASAKEGVVDGADKNAKSIGDLAKTPAFRKKGFGGLDVPLQRAVLSHVVGAAQDSQIRKLIVQLIPVDVMNVLIGPKRTTNMLLNEHSVFKAVFSATGMRPISIFNPSITSLIDAVTLGGTKDFFASADLMGLPTNGLPATIAGEHLSSARLADALASGRAIDVLTARDLTNGAADRFTAGGTIDNRHDVTPSSDVGLEAGEGDTSSASSIISAHPSMYSRRAAPVSPSEVEATLFDELRFKAQDKFHYLNKVQKAVATERGIKELPEAEDAYLAELRYHGMAGAAIEDFQSEHVDPLIEAISAAKLGLEDVDLYLRARHAEEANAQLERINPDREDNQALSGMSNEEAAEILARLDSPAMRDIGQRVDAITKARRDKLVDAGLETQETVDAWEAAYQHYVPLKREGFDGGLPSKGKGFNTRGKEKRRAGSSREVVHVLANVVAQYEATAIKAEKVKVGKAFLEFARNNPNPDLYEIDKVEYKPTFDAEGLVTYREDKGFVMADNVLTVRVDGVDHRITFDKRSPVAMRIAHALNNLGATESGPIVNALSKLTRWLAIVNTGASPEFVISNFARDLQTAGYNLTATAADKLKWKIIKDVGKSWRGIRSFQKQDGKHHEWAQYFDEFRRAGAQTGWLQSYSNIEDREQALIQKIRDMSKDTMGLKVKAGMRAVIEFIENENTAVENAIRLSAFVHARRSGLSEAQAARIAKEMTVNFNRKGDMGQVLNALYLFYNASIQGSVRLLQAVGKSRKVQLMAGATVIFAAILDMINRSLGGDDDDGEAKYDKIPDFVKERNLIIMLPSGGGDYIKIPLPWGYNVLHVMGQGVGEAMTQRDFQPGKSAMRVAAATVSAFNPIGGSESLLQFLSPTITDPLVQWAENKDWAGKPLRPASNPFGVDTPNSQKYWNSVRAPSKWLTDQLNTMTGGDEVRPGAIDISPEAIDLLVDTFTGGAGRFVADTFATPAKVVQGEAIETYEVPVLRKVYGAPGRGTLVSDFYERMEAVQVTDKQLKHYKGDHAKISEIRRDRAGEVRLLGDMKLAQSHLRKIRKQIKAAEKSGNEVGLKSAREREEKVMRQFNKAYNAKMLRFEKAS